jgi:hypothetical protein
MAKNDTSQTTQNNDLKASVSTSSNKSSNPNNLKIVVMLIVLIAVAAGAYLLFGAKDKTSEQGSSASQTTSEVTVLGSSKGKGMNFSRPAELSPVTWQDTNNLRSFIKLSPSNKQEAYVDVSRLLAASLDYKSSSDPNQAYIDDVASTLKDPNSPTYSSDISALTNFVKQGFTEGPIAVNLGVAKHFTNSNIKKNAWIFDVTTVDSSNITPTHRGVLVYALGENAIYRFMYTKTTAKWNADNNSWQTVLDSIKIDQ